MTSDDSDSSRPEGEDPVTGAVDEWADRQHEKAFINAKKGFELFGQPLNGYTPSRKVAAQSMGMIYPFLSDNGVVQMQDTGTYPGCLKDTIILLWLCSLPDPKDQTKKQLQSGEWNPSRAASKPDQAFGEAMKWAEEKKFVDVSTKEFEQAYSVFMAIASGVTASEFEIKIENTGHPEEDIPKV